MTDPTQDADAVRALVDEQAEDEGLWFIAQTAPEAYLQQELRRLHAAVEELLNDGPLLCENCGKPMAEHDDMAHCWVQAVGTHTDGSGRTLLSFEELCEQVGFDPQQFDAG